jgi:antirestriction protein ArdC
MTASERDQQYAEGVASLLIEQLKKGLAPWQQPWDNARFVMPHNALTEQPYRGVNAMFLMAQGIERGYSDGRWLTFAQAKQMEAIVRKGEHGTPIVVVKQGYEIIERDDAGKPVLDDAGKPKKRYVLYERPRMKFYTVFAAEQCDGIPVRPQTRPMHDWERHQRAETLLKESGAHIEHGGNRAFYLPGLDYITLPQREQFPSSDRYYATALHELGHWTGHKERLDRDLSGGFGSEFYAKEELRAEISSLMVGQTMELGHDPTRHGAYVDNWIKILQDDPKEIVRACADASKIHTYVLQYDREINHSENLSQSREVERDTAYLAQQNALIHQGEQNGRTIENAYSR